MAYINTPKNQSKYTLYGVEMTSQRLLNMSIEVLYLPKNVYPKQIFGYAPVKRSCVCGCVPW